jgi:hypothetical protein
MADHLRRHQKVCEVGPRWFAALRPLALDGTDYRSPAQGQLHHGVTDPQVKAA